MEEEELPLLDLQEEEEKVVKKWRKERREEIFGETKEDALINPLNKGVFKRLFLESSIFSPVLIIFLISFLGTAGTSNLFFLTILSAFSVSFLILWSMASLRNLATERNYPLTMSEWIWKSVAWNNYKEEPPSVLKLVRKRGVEELEKIKSEMFGWGGKYTKRIRKVEKEKTKIKKILMKGYEIRDRDELDRTPEPLRDLIQKAEEKRDKLQNRYIELKSKKQELKSKIEESIKEVEQLEVYEEIRDLYKQLQEVDDDVGEFQSKMIQEIQQQVGQALKKAQLYKKKALEDLSENVQLGVIEEEAEQMFSLPQTEQQEQQKEEVVE